MSPKALVNLPVELICQVLNYLEINDLLNCSVLNRHFQTIIHSSSRFLYLIELGKCGLVSVLPPSQHPSFHSRLRVLQEREHAWSRGTWKRRHKMKTPFRGSVYDFVSGIYGSGGEDIDGTTTSISFLELPSTTWDNGSPEPRIWIHSMPDLLIFDFTMDPSQDLLVLLALASPSSKHIYELHLRALSTNEPHPHAPCHRIPCISGSHENMQLSDLNPVVTLQVIGDLVAVLFKELIVDLGALLSIWNWKLGPKYSSTMHRISGIDDFTFLDEETFLLVRPAERLEVYKFAAPIKRNSNPECIVSLDLPPLSSQYRYWYITLSTNPTPGYVPWFSNSSFAKANASDNAKVISSEHLYYPKPHERVLACCLYIFDITQPQENSVHSFVFFVNAKTFLKPVEYWSSVAPDGNLGSSPNQALCRHIQDTNRGGSIESNGELSRQQDQGSDSNLPQASALRNHIEDDTGTHSNIPPTSVTLNEASAVGDQNVQSETDDLSDISSSIPSITSLPSVSSVPSHSDSLLLSNPSTGSRRRSGRHPPGQPPNIPWEVWGPENTRWFNGNWQTDWQHATYGLRTADSVRVRYREPRKWDSRMNGTDEQECEILSEWEPELAEGPGSSAGEQDIAVKDAPNTLRWLRVRDYNPYSVACTSERLRNGEGKNPMSPLNDRTGDSREASPPNPRMRVVTEPSITPTRGVYKDDIKSCLPYVEMISEEKLDITDVMLDDRRLLLLKRDGRGLLVSIDVLMM